MTSFEKVNKVWCDLEEAYVKRNNGLSRMDFLKKILMYDSGEAAIRNLVKKVSDDRGDATDSDVEELVTKLQIAMTKIKENPNYQIDDLNLFISEKSEAKVSCATELEIPKIGLKTVDVTIEQLLYAGRLRPSKVINSKRGSDLKQEVVRDYYYYCDGKRDLVNMLEQTKYGDFVTLYKAATTFSRDGKLKLPLIVTNTETVMKIITNPRVNGIVSVAETNIDNKSVNLFYVMIRGAHHCILEIQFMTLDGVFTEGYKKLVGELKDDQEKYLRVIAEAREMPVEWIEKAEGILFQIMILCIFYLDREYFSLIATEMVSVFGIML